MLHTEQIFFVHTEIDKAFLQINHLERTGEYRLSPHSHDRWQVICVTDGELTVTTESGAHILRAGAIHILPPGFTHALHSKGYRQVGIDFSEDYFQPSYLHTAFCEPICVSAPKLSEHVRALTDLDRSDSISRKLMKSLCEVIILSAVKLSNITAADTAKQRITEYIDSHLSGEFRLSHMSSELFISVSQLERLSNKYFGCGLTAFRNRKRCEKACELLVGTSSPISVIGSSLGFSEPSNFSAFFKRYMGMSPAIYRVRFSEARG